MTQQMTATAPLDAGTFEKVLVQGDLARLTPAERLSFYQHVCQSLGLNPLTQPFAYLTLKDDKRNDKLVLYATKACTDQLRQIHGIRLEITDKKMEGGCWVVTARATTPDGRTDEDIGVVPLQKENGTWQQGNNNKSYFKGDGTFRPLNGDALANALMKGLTKAKRRVTLSICGLGMLDESEIDSIPNAEVITVEPAPKAAEPAKAIDQAKPEAAKSAPAPAPKPAAPAANGNGEHKPEPAAKNDAPKPAADDPARQKISRTIFEEYAAKFRAAKTADEVHAAADGLTTEMTKLMTAAHVEELRTVYVDEQERCKRYGEPVETA